MRVNRSYGRDPRSRTEWALGWTGLALLAAVFGSFLIVYLPADNALTRWRVVASSLHGCSIDVWHPIWTQQSDVLTSLLLTTVLVEVIAFVLLGLGWALAIRRQRRERAQVWGQTAG